MGAAGAIGRWNWGIEAFRVPGAAQRETVRCRPGTFPHSELGTAPDQRCTASALHRIRGRQLASLAPQGDSDRMAARPARQEFPMPLSDTIKTLIRNAWDDGYPCLLATVGRQGPNITPKGSMIVYNDAHLAWWERSKRAVLENLSHDKRVCVMYANFKAQRDGVLIKIEKAIDIRGKPIM